MIRTDLKIYFPDLQIDIRVILWQSINRNIFLVCCENGNNSNNSRLNSVNSNVNSANSSKLVEIKNNVAKSTAKLN